MKIGKLFNNIINEALSEKQLKALKDANASTYPMIPVNRVFFHDVPDMDTIYKSIGNAAKDIDDNGSKNFKLEKINVKMIVPTQKNVNVDNLKTTEDIGPDTNAELSKYGQFYFIIDGHHRIANAILQGNDEIEAYVYTDKPISESVLDEDYPTNFVMDEFKQLNSFNARIKYCQERLRRLSSGSSRIVYQIDDEKVLKLAKNKKGLAQNDAETSAGNDSFLSGLVANIFDYDENDLWVEMELAGKVSPKHFLNITGVDFETYCDYIYNVVISNNPSKYRKYSKRTMDPAIVSELEENEFAMLVIDYIMSYDIPFGDLCKLNSYGIVKRNGVDDIVLIDYGLTNSVLGDYYS